MSEEYTDRFSKSSEELTEKSAFVCDSCKKEYSRQEAQNQGQKCCGTDLTEKSR